MDLDIIILSEVRSERQRQIPYDITYVWNLKYDTNERIYQIEIALETIENRLVVSKARGEGGVAWESEISRCKLLYIGCINNKAPLYSTGTIFNIL